MRCCAIAFVSGNCIEFSDCAIAIAQAQPKIRKRTALLQENMLELGDLSVHGAVL